MYILLFSKKSFITITTTATAPIMYYRSPLNLNSQRIIMVCSPALTLPARIASARLGRRLQSQSISLVEATASACLSHYVISSPLDTSETSIQTQQTRLMSSLGRLRISQTNASSSSVQPTYSALRNKVTIPCGARQGKSYVSPYSEFFANVEAGQTSLGTTEEVEQRAFELQEQHLECGIPESELRFRTTSYGRFVLPPYVSPGEHRVTMLVALSAIPFQNEQEKEVFLEIVGSRFNSKKEELKLSSEKFASRIENKRYLVDMIERIVSSARTLAKEFDTGDKATSADS